MEWTPTLVPSYCDKTQIIFGRGCGGVGAWLEMMPYISTGIYRNAFHFVILWSLVTNCGPWYAIRVIMFYINAKRRQGSTSICLSK